jgi:hypothetical protein
MKNNKNYDDNGTTTTNFLIGKAAGRSFEI